MIRETIVPKDRAHWLSLRAADVTSTEVAALFGLSPYVTQFELWHRHRTNAILQLEPNERMNWGSRLEPAIAGGLAEDHGWKLRPMKEYIRLPERRLGASFDYSTVDDDGILECKNVDSLAFRDGWIVDGDEVEAPPHIEIQVQAQLAVSGKKLARIGVLVGGNKGVVLEREPDHRVIMQLFEKAERFWETVDKGIEPTPDYARDSEFISALYSQASNGKVLNVMANPQFRALCEAYKFQSELEKQAKTQKEALKAQILMQCQDAEKVVGDGFSISLGNVAPTSVAYERAGYRNFRLNWKKEARQ